MGLTSVLESASTVFLAYLCLCQMPTSGFPTLHAIIRQFSFLFRYIFFPFPSLETSYASSIDSESISLSSSVRKLMVT